jgi:hypothetical protein
MANLENAQSISIVVTNEGNDMKIMVNNPPPYFLRDDFKKMIGENVISLVSAVIKKTNEFNGIETDITVLEPVNGKPNQPIN